MGNEARKENWNQIVEGLNARPRNVGVVLLVIELLLKGSEQRSGLMERYLRRLS